MPHKVATLKQKKWVGKYLETGNATEAAMQVYDTQSRPTAANIGWANLHSDGVQEYLQSKAQMAAERIETLAAKAKNEQVRLNANRDILDRAGYKPVDRAEIRETKDLYSNDQLKRAASELLSGRTDGIGTGGEG